MIFVGIGIGIVVSAIVCVVGAFIFGYKMWNNS